MQYSKKNSEGKTVRKRAGYAYLRVSKADEVLITSERNERSSY